MRPFLAALVGVGLGIGALGAYCGGADPQPPGRPPPQPAAKPPEPTAARPPGRPPLGYAPGWSPYWGGYPYLAWYAPPGYGYAYELGPSVYVPYYGGPIILPPLYLPAETNYGPEAVKRFMGLDHWNAPRSSPGPRAHRPDDVSGQDKAPPSQRGTNPESVARARRFIAIGDRMFGERKYADAYENYRQAAQAAPRLADSYFRQGFALVATARYESAARAFKRGLGLDADWPRSDFRLDLLYRDNGVDKATHVDVLATAAVEKPQEADLLFLTGICLHFDGQAERARPFFQRAGQLSGEDARHLKAFEPLPGRHAAADGPF